MECLKSLQTLLMILKNKKARCVKNKKLLAIISVVVSSIGCAFGLFSFRFNYTSLVVSLFIFTWFAFESLIYTWALDKLKDVRSVVEYVGTKKRMLYTLFLTNLTTSTIIAVIVQLIKGVYTTFSS